MGSLEKHKRNLIEEWPEGEAGVVPAQSGSAHGSGAQGRPVRLLPRRSPPPIQSAVAPKPDTALFREAAPPPKLDEKHSQLSSPEHLRRLERLPKLRAPYSPKSGRPASGPRA
jgi:hypothetical protein